MALIEVPGIFQGIDGLCAAVTLRGRARTPYGFNLSLSVGDEERRVIGNRDRLTRLLGFAPDRLATQRQVHGNAVAVVAEGYSPSESDAMTTIEEGWLLGVSIADCVPVLLYDRRSRAIAAVHSGWRGSRLEVVVRTIQRMSELWGTRASDLLAYVGASAGQCCYEVGEDVSSAFDGYYSRAIGGGGYLFDNRAVVLDQLVSAGVPEASVQLDQRCTICSPLHQSYRREGSRSGRMLAVIGLQSGRQGPWSLEAA